MLLSEEARKALRFWRESPTARTWPDFCSLSTESLDGDDYALAALESARQALRALDGREFTGRDEDPEDVP